MRIERLELRAFGSFTDAPPLDFSQGKEGIHIVYGPNEAGKSTALRALTHALYGIPQRSEDNFIHPYAKLRIGMTIRSDDTILAFLRRKGTGSTLREYDDESKVIDDSRLFELLGGIDETVFRTLFGLHHEDLVIGGKEILEGGGEIGHALFAAASGLAEVRAIHKEIADEAESIFSPRANKPLLNGLLSTFKVTSSTLKEATISTQAWLEKEKELKEAETHCRQVEQSYTDADKEHRRLERFRKALPLLTLRKDTMAALIDLRDVPQLREGFPAFWRGALANLKGAERSRDGLKTKLQTNRTKRESLRLDPHILAQSETIEALWKDVNRILATRTDRQTVLDEVRMLEFEIRRLLDTLQRGASIETASTLQIEPKVRREMQRLANTRAAITRDLQRAHEEYERVQRERDTLQEALAQEKNLPNIRPLEETVKRIRKAGDLDNQREAFEDDAERLAAEINKQLARLGAGWKGTLDDIESTSVPEDETVERFARNLDEAIARIAQCEDRCIHLENEHSEQRHQLDTFKEGGPLPSEDDLTRQRQTRDTGWHLVRRQWEALHIPEDISDEEIGVFTKEMGKPSNLADAFSEAVTVADGTADTLRYESGRVAQRTQQEITLGNLTRQLERAQQDRTDAISAKEKVLSEWSDLWNNIGIKPLLPREMESWLRRREKVLDLAKQSRDAQSGCARTTTTIARYKDDLRKVIEILATEPPSNDASFTQWIDFADLAVSDAASHRRVQDDRQNVLSKLFQEGLPIAKRTLEAKEEAVSEWQTEWKRTMDAMGLPENTDVETAQEIAEIYGEIAKDWGQLQMQRKRIDEMTYLEEEFSTRAQALCEHVAPDLVNRPAEQAVQELYMRLQSFQAAEKEQCYLDKEYESLQEELDQVIESIARFQMELEQACKDVRVASAEMLPEAEEHALNRQKHEQTLEHLDERLADLAGGEKLENFIGALDKEDPDGLASRCAELEQCLEQLCKDRDASVNAAAELRVRFDDLNRHEESVHTTESLEGLRAEIEEAIEQYVRLKAAEAVLQAAMERYRSENQEPLLKRTAEIFRALTMSSFVDLRTDLDDKGQQILVGIRNNDNSGVKVNGMSDGTTDQLFLALRLSSIEQYALKGKSFPFIADDILVNFDDDRAIAAFGVLAEFSKTVQVIFFTHHQHLLEIAKASVPRELLFVHELQR